MNKAKSRVNEFGLIYMGYMTFLAARKSYGFWLPSVLTTLQVSRGEAGVLGSSFEFVYGGCALLPWLWLVNIIYFRPCRRWAQ